MIDLNTPIGRRITAGVLLAVILIAGAWLLLTRGTHSSHQATADSANKKVLYYQSPMHPWVKSDKPGRCTVCGMELVPVYEGAQPVQAATDVVMLPPGAPNVASLKTVETRRQPLARKLRVAGTIDDDESRHRILSAYTGGRVEKLFVNYEGAEVQQGQPLATFYSKDLIAAIREYKVAFGQGPSPMLTAARMRLTQLGMSEDQIATAHKRSETDIFISILSPVTGTVVKRYVYEGQYVQEGEKLFELGDFAKMWFQFIAYEQDLPFLKVGQNVSVRTPALPDKSFRAQITFINPNIDDATRSARVRVEIDNPNRELRHKLYAEGTVDLDAPEVLAVPKSAVLWPGDNPRLYVDRGNGAYQQRRVILGRPGDDFWEVLEGVNEGERVVVSGNMLIDSQAQLQNVSAPSDESPPLNDPALEMTATQHAAMEKYITAVADITAALARDDLGAFNDAKAKLPPAPEGLTQPSASPAADLASARREFLPLSESVANYAMHVRAHFPKLRVFRCPMTNTLGEGLPNNAKWIQFSNKLQNPFFGREMLECGAEVK
ncbi:MAG TPA: efflux RND transporter periplasmic adaptor subunit [Chthoniobacterales bacterium]|nr:efflux RND transporter periplasmic adaptor subunit [Chthoniobacterales bacterium]